MKCIFPPRGFEQSIADESIESIIGEGVSKDPQSSVLDRMRRDGYKAPQDFCSPMGPKRHVSYNGEISKVRTFEDSLRSTFVFRYNQNVRYAHMAMIAYWPGGGGGKGFEGSKDILVAAWQAAPGVPPQNGVTRMAVEGLSAQEIMISYSEDGGASWSEGEVVPTDALGAVWSPVLHVDEATNRLFLFFSESNQCLRDSEPPTFMPGGHLRMMHTRRRNAKWSRPATILPQGQGKPGAVLANKPRMTTRGELVLPFWREWTQDGSGNICDRSANSTRGEGDEDDAAMMDPEGLDHVDELQETRRTRHGVLISKDGGITWKEHGKLSDPKMILLEGALVPLLPSEGVRKMAPFGKMLMVMRSNRGCAFKSESLNQGQSWGPVEPMGIINPNSKMDIVRLEPSGALVMAFNNHYRGTWQGESCHLCRTVLSLAVSLDDGAHWTFAGVVDAELSHGVRIHYPTLQQVDDRLYIIYSRFYLRSMQGMNSNMQGIALAVLPIESILGLPHVQMPEPQISDPGAFYRRKVPKPQCNCDSAKFGRGQREPRSGLVHSRHFLPARELQLRAISCLYTNAAYPKQHPVCIRMHPTPNNTRCEAR